MAKVTDRIVSLNLSADQLRSSGLNDSLIQEFINQQQNVNQLAQSADVDTEQIALNTQDIESNRSAIQANTQAIGVNSSEISTINQSLSTLSVNFNNHVQSDSEHGVTGSNVGTGDFASTVLGGVVLQSQLVADATDTSVQVTLPDIGSVPATYDQAYINTIATMVNQLKASINQLSDDMNDKPIQQLNDLIAKSKDAGQMSSS